MSLFSFYEIKSQKSLEFEKGLRKTSLVCLDHPDILLFLWLNEDSELKQVQFLFDENLIEWADGKKGLTAAETNRKTNDFPQKTGLQKGARTIHDSQDRTIIKRGLQIINASKFPDSYDQMIRHNLLFPFIKNKSATLPVS
ncbi:hypothetical protein KJ966_23835 [bacterium]|nr:hypothetical protein [bacterium]